MKIPSAATLLLVIESVDAFAPFQLSTTPIPSVPFTGKAIPEVSRLHSIYKRGILFATSDNDSGEEKKENPYQDPNYPDLEFVNYDDPEYQVDQGVGDEFFGASSTSESDTEERIEAMREERRMRNDEFQFETYFKEILKEGQEYKGEWTVYTTSTFSDEIKEQSDAIPNIKKASKPIKVISRGERIELTGDDSSVATHRLQNHRLLHHERVFSDSEDGEKSPEQLKQEEVAMSVKYCPEKLASGDFRGHQGIMCVGNGYTICTAIKLLEDSNAAHLGPFAEYRSELGIQFEELRFRVKLDYSVTDAEKESMRLPPLRLRSFTVCRETLGMWPRASNYKSAIEALTDTVLFGPPGAEGGLYDPPPVGSEQQAGQYLLLDLEGGATLLLPFFMNQDPHVHPDSGWVTSLDWSPGKLRFQVDRKINGGKDILGLRTLELSEVQSADAETYRPRDGGADMPQ